MTTWETLQMGSGWKRPRGRALEGALGRSCVKPALTCVPASPVVFSGIHFKFYLVVLFIWFFFEFAGVGGVFSLCSPGKT